MTRRCSAPMCRCESPCQTYTDEYPGYCDECGGNPCKCEEHRAEDPAHNQEVNSGKVER